MRVRDDIPVCLPTSPEEHRFLAEYAARMGKSVDEVLWTFNALENHLRYGDDDPEIVFRPHPFIRDYHCNDCVDAWQESERRFRRRFLRLLQGIVYGALGPVKTIIEKERKERENREWQERTSNEINSEELKRLHREGKV